MYELISINDHMRWKNVMETFGVSDIYYTHQYFKSALKLDAGEAFLFHYADEDGGEVVYPFIKRQLKTEEPVYYDITTPFGYGGPLLKTSNSGSGLAGNFIRTFSAFCEEEKIIVEYIRFHPLKKNALFFQNYMQLVALYETYTIELDDFQLPLAEESEVQESQEESEENQKITIKKLGTVRHLFEFLILYYSTVRRREESDSYYFFINDYFEVLISNLGSDLHLFGAFCRNKLIAASYILAKGDTMYHHLSGNLEEYEKLDAMKELLLKIAEWGEENYFSSFHMGGDFEGGEMPVKKTKEELSNSDPSIFYIGKKIHNHYLYNDLVLSEETDFIKRYRNV